MVQGRTLAGSALPGVIALAGWAVATQGGQEPQSGIRASVYFALFILVAFPALMVRSDHPAARVAYAVLAGLVLVASVPVALRYGRIDLPVAALVAFIGLPQGNAGRTSPG